MNTILVTGGLGYIGSHCSLELLKQGHNILIIDSLINSSIEVKSKIELLLNKKKIKKKGLLFFRKGDLRNKEWLKRTFEEFKVWNNKFVKFPAICIYRFFRFKYELVPVIFSKLL